MRPHVFAGPSVTSRRRHHASIRFAARRPAAIRRAMVVDRLVPISAHLPPSPSISHLLSPASDGHESSGAPSPPYLPWPPLHPTATCASGATWQVPRLDRMCRPRLLLVSPVRAHAIRCLHGLARDQSLLAQFRKPKLSSARMERASGRQGLGELSAYLRISPHVSTHLHKSPHLSANLRVQGLGELSDGRRAHHALDTLLAFVARGP